MYRGSSGKLLETYSAREFLKYSRLCLLTEVYVRTLHGTENFSQNSGNVLANFAGPPVSGGNIPVNTQIERC